MKVFTDEFLKFARGVSDYYKSTQDYGLWEVYMHLKSEVDESYRVADAGYIVAAREELGDVITMTMGVFHELESTDDEIEAALDAVTDKLGRRVT